MTHIEITEIPDSLMRFFTPDLVLRVNSEDDAVADAAHEDWEWASAAYQHHLKRILPDAPRSVQWLANSCFHDAALIQAEFSPRAQESDFGPRVIAPFPTFAPAVFSVSVASEGRSTGLVYQLWDAPNSYPVTGNWQRTGRGLWLYDEVDVVWSRFGMYVHRILLDNGTIFEIPFFHVSFVEAPPRENVSRRKGT